ncbi:MAG TPA: replicative DNA helicase [Candidatus Fusicatenibacter intestinigallinarum]|uniref:Replicative DNA helicase n=1 Tax=Candidatus Fusicatenibacter intestinigallinarum TaxID=2838598 RepID=A0A9D2NAG5_9FIRM|nr:replicative DNA helicase [Candidatus Fusicatenibacter intestinigallinarum]
MEEALIKRILPHSIEAEQSVIGSMLMGREAIMAASEMLTSDDFYQHQYGVIFDAMVELFNEGKPVDLVTLQNRLKEKDLPPEITSMEFVRDLLNAVPTSANVRHYATIVSEKAVLRRLIRLSEEIENECYLNKEPVEVILEETEKRMFQLLQQRNSGDYVPIRQVVMNTLENIERASKTKGSVTGLPTGFTDLDYKTSGLQPSDFILIAARPSMGKTAFVLNIAQYMAFKKDKAVAIFSLEMSREQLMNRLFSMESKVDSQNLRTGNLKDEDWSKLIESAGMIGESKLIIDDTPGISIGELRSKCRKYKLEHGLDIVIIDYLQLMTGSGRRTDSRQQEISDISRALKALARELNVPVVALSQLSRAVEQRTDHRPMLSDLRESGAIEQDADVVMFIYRDDYYNKDSEDKGIAEIIIAKQRNGPIGTVNLVWLPDYTKFANIQR